MVQQNMSAIKEQMQNILIFEIFDNRAQSMNHKINLLLKNESKKLLKKNYYSLIR